MAGRLDSAARRVRRSACMVGVLVRLYDAELDELGEAHLPAPVEPSDLVANELGLWRIRCVVACPADDRYAALAEVRRDRRQMTTRQSRDAEPGPRAGLPGQGRSQ